MKNRVNYVFVTEFSSNELKTVINVAHMVHGQPFILILMVIRSGFEWLQIVRLKAD